MNLSSDAAFVDALKMIRTGDSASWRKIAEEETLAVFRDASRNAPAYASFLRERGFDPARIECAADLALLPDTGKKDYVRAFARSQLASGGALRGALVYTSTSGSTGEPTYFYRTTELDRQYSILAELFLENSSYRTGGPVLVIVAFGMGVWIGGLITYKAFELAAARRGGVSIITPGINKKEILAALEKLAPEYAEVIIAGYPPFLKDIVDEARSRRIDLAARKIRFLFAAEAFSETFRDYLAQSASIGNVYLDTLNIYGTAELGAMAYETPTSILIRRIALESRPLFQDLFGDIPKVPTLAQYNPRFVNFETGQRGDILITAGGAMPLVRYAVGDSGGTATFAETAAILERHGVDLGAHAAEAGIGKPYEMPFVFVYERNDLSTTLYGLQVYPEHVREALLHRSIRSKLTGRFTLLTKFDGKHDQRLEVHVELAGGRSADAAFKKRVTERILESLEEKNSEFRELCKHLGRRAHPKVVFWPAGHSKYFTAGIKQKWIQRP